MHLSCTFFFNHARFRHKSCIFRDLLDLCSKIICMAISTNTLLKMVWKLKVKAPGEDNISNKLIKEGGLRLTQHLRTLFTLSINTGHLPSSWKIAIVVPIFKEGKDAKEPTSYRPLSLLPAFSKLLETIVSRHLFQVCNQLNILPEHQFGRGGQKPKNKICLVP